MKLITKGDDYGFTKGVTLGIIEAIDNGILRNTGIFTNMPAAVHAVTLMEGRDHACFGIDFNLVSGPCVSDPKDIPHLVDENGWFIRSNVRIKDPRWQSEEGRREMFPFEEVYRELNAQYDKFLELTNGKKPGYVGGHSLSYETFKEAIARLAKERDVCSASEMLEKINAVQIGRRSTAASTKKTFDPLEQLNKPVTQNVLEDKEKLLEAEYAIIGTHPGYLDAELLGLTSLSLERVRDLEMLTHPEIKKLIEENNIELVTFQELYETFKK